MRYIQIFDEEAAETLRDNLAFGLIPQLAVIPTTTLILEILPLVPDTPN